MPKKLTQEQVESIFKKNGLTLCKDQIYINKCKKLNCYDDNGFFYNITLDCVQDKRTKKYDIVGKRNLFSIKNIQHYIEIRGSKTKILSKKYISNRDKLNFKCECGNGCNNCSYTEAKKDIKLTDKNIEEICLNSGYKVLNGFEHTPKEVYVQDKEGYQYRTSIYNIQHMKNKYNKFSKKSMFTVFNMLNYLKLNDINIKIVDETERKIEIGKDMIELKII